MVLLGVPSTLRMPGIDIVCHYMTQFCVSKTNDFAKQLQNKNKTEQFIKHVQIEPMVCTMQSNFCKIFKPFSCFGLEITLRHD